MDRPGQDGEAPSCCALVPLPMQGSASLPLKRPSLSSLSPPPRARQSADALDICHLLPTTTEYLRTWLRFAVSGPAPLVIYMGTPPPQFPVNASGPPTTHTHTHTYANEPFLPLFPSLSCPLSCPRLAAAAPHSPPLPSSVPSRTARLRSPPISAAAASPRQANPRPAAAAAAVRPVLS